jgi:signal transduction histidine kinase
MSISLLFSVGFYKVSSDEIVRGIRQQPLSVNNLLQTRSADLLNDIIDNQNDAIIIAKARLQASLLLINLFILVGGGMLSYLLARRTLLPIEEIHEAQSRFTADASHELRTPIAAMRLENEIALGDDKLSLKQAKEQISSNIEELDKLTALSESLLKLARLDNVAVKKSKTSVEDIIMRSIDRVSKQAEAKKQLIKTKKIDKGHIEVDGDSIVEALVTILDNAIKYSPKKSEITFATKRSLNTIEFLIKDNGVGIAQEKQDKIFNRFYRVDDSRQKNDSDGYGIGLSIAEMVARSHGGNINLSSELSKGSEFKLCIPIK